MKIKTSKTTPIQINWLVAMCEGKRPSLFIFKQTGKLASEHNYSADWDQGGPIIEREKITISDYKNMWVAGYNSCPLSIGPTPLIAAMRAFVSSKLGDEVEVPDGLC